MNNNVYKYYMSSSSYDSREEDTDFVPRCGGCRCDNCRRRTQTKCESSNKRDKSPPPIRNRNCRCDKCRPNAVIRKPQQDLSISSCRDIGKNCITITNDVYEPRNIPAKDCKFVNQINLFF
jgi:hypothetical protein